MVTRDNMSNWQTHNIAQSTRSMTERSTPSDPMFLNQHLGIIKSPARQSHVVHPQPGYQTQRDSFGVFRPARGCLAPDRSSSADSAEIRNAAPAELLSGAKQPLADRMWLTDPAAPDPVNMASPGRYQLLACELSYFSGKIRPYLRYKNIPFDSVTATEEVYEKMIYPRVGWNVVPVVITPDDKTLQDTTSMIEYLERKHPEPSVLPTTPWSFMEQRKFVDLQFGRAAAPTSPPLEQMDNPQRFISYENFKNSPQILGINEETIPEIERSYKGFLDDFQTHLSRYPYLLGDKPCVADFAFCGPLYPHLYRDPVPADLMGYGDFMWPPVLIVRPTNLPQNAPRRGYPFKVGFLMRCRAPVVACWVETMIGVLRESPADVYTVVDGKAVKAPPPQVQPGFLPNDEIPETLFPILQRMFTEQGPVLLDAIQKFKEYIKESGDDTDLMRVVGVHDFRLGNVTSVRGVFVYPLWMLQRITDYYTGLSPGQQRAVDRFLDRFQGGHELVKADLSRCRVERKSVGVRLARPGNAKL
ncbi:hypothetical protein Bbelb_327160 [Branchiostoma belcheri]|nr:hypothetical protein Bbelb_327160 [Branchiostoma belcheri]